MKYSIIIYTMHIAHNHCDTVGYRIVTIEGDHLVVLAYYVEILFKKQLYSQFIDCQGSISNQSITFLMRNRLNLWVSVPSYWVARIVMTMESEIRKQKVFQNMIRTVIPAPSGSAILIFFRNNCFICGFTEGIKRMGIVWTVDGNPAVQMSHRFHGTGRHRLYEVNPDNLSHQPRYIITHCTITPHQLHIAINGHFVVATVARWHLRGMRQLNRHFRTLQSLYIIFFWLRIEKKTIYIQIKISSPI